MRRSFYCALLILIAIRLQAQSDTTTLQQWKDLKYSMFIHYGIYSVLGGVWDGKPVARGLSEQIQAHAGIYSDTYAAVAKQFNPVFWNADSIAILAKAAGMRSIVITSKHHDGFCMFHSAHTDFNVVDATPFKRDIVKELSDACKRHGLKFGLYFSIIDWHFPQASPISSHNSDYVTPEHHAYNKKQVTELLTNYGPVSELWFDMGSQSVEQSKDLRELVHSLQPDCLVSSRLGNDMGDFTVMGDNQEPDYRIGVPWQSPASFFDETWGYRSWQKRGDEEEKKKEKLASLIRVVSRGGNYLLNIGPEGDGSVVDFEKHVLLSIGSWLDKNKEAIYGTQPDPFHISFDWGNITSRKDKLYLHIMADPKDGVIKLPGLKGKVKKAYVLAGKKKIKFSTIDSSTILNIPEDLDPEEEFKVIVVELNGPYSVIPPGTLTNIDENTRLNSNNSFKHYSNSGIDYNTRFRSTIKESWFILPKTDRSLVPQIFYTEEEKGREILLTMGTRQLHVTLEGGEASRLQNDLSAITWGQKYYTGPYWSGIEGTHGDPKHIDVTKPWTNSQDHQWGLLNERSNGETYNFPGEAMSAYYVLQEISTTVDQPLLVDITSGDGVVVFVNGEEKLTRLNAYKNPSQRDVLLINLKKGKNQLLVKYFNNFSKTIPASIEQSKEQVIYSKRLDPLTFQGKMLNTVSLSLYKPITAHQDLRLPNLFIMLQNE